MRAKRRKKNTYVKKREAYLRHWEGQILQAVLDIARIETFGCYLGDNGAWVGGRDAEGYLLYLNSHLKAAAKSMLQELTVIEHKRRDGFRLIKGVNTDDE